MESQGVLQGTRASRRTLESLQPIVALFIQSLANGFPAPIIRGAVSHLLKLAIGNHRGIDLEALRHSLEKGISLPGT
jgi:hypothetical protein